MVEGLTTPHRKKKRLTNPLDKPRNWTNSLVRPQKMHNDMRFGTWKVTSLYKTGVVTLVARELAKCRLDLVGVQEVRLDGKGISPIGDYMLYYGKGNNNHQLGTWFFIHNKIAVKNIEFIRDRLSYLILRVRWCSIIVIISHASTEDKVDLIKDGFYEELKHTCML